MSTAFVRFVAAALLVLSGVSAQASVVYSWVNLTYSENAPVVSGSMAFDDVFWLTHNTLSYVDGGALYTDAPQSLIAFQMIVGDSGITSSVRLDRFLCSDRAWDCDTSVHPGYVTYGNYDFNLSLGSVLTGSILASDTHSSIRMASAGTPVWSISQYGTDGPGPIACFMGNCGGGTGLWVLDRNTIPTVAAPIPEPETYAMWLLGMAALAFRRVARKGSNTS